jgi:hypothetical protein
VRIEDDSMTIDQIPISQATFVRLKLIDKSEKNVTVLMSRDDLC